MSDDRTFSKIKAAQFLRRQGYKIGKTKLYDDAQKGLIQIQADGKIKESDLWAYVSAVGLDQPDVSGPDPSQVQEAQREKTELEKQELQIKIEERTFKLERERGRYIPREDLELELASRAGVFDSGLRTMIKANARDWVAMVHGRADLVPDLVETMFTELDKLLNEYARMDRFQVIFEEDA